MLQRGLSSACSDNDSKFDGLWRFGNDNGVASIYRSLYSTISRRMTELPDARFRGLMADISVSGLSARSGGKSLPLAAAAANRENKTIMQAEPWCRDTGCHIGDAINLLSVAATEQN